MLFNDSHKIVKGIDTSLPIAAPSVRSNFLEDESYICVRQECILYITIIDNMKEKILIYVRMSMFCIYNECSFI